MAGAGSPDSMGAPGVPSWTQDRSAPPAPPRWLESQSQQRPSRHPRSSLSARLGHQGARGARAGPAAPPWRRGKSSPPHHYHCARAGVRGHSSPPHTPGHVPSSPFGRGGTGGRAAPRPASEEGSLEEAARGARGGEGSGMVARGHIAHPRDPARTQGRETWRGPERSGDRRRGAGRREACPLRGQLWGPPLHAWTGLQVGSAFGVCLRMQQEILGTGLFATTAPAGTPDPWAYLCDIQRIVSIM